MPSYCINRVTLLGSLGRDPEVRSLSSGDRLASFSIATSEYWFDKNGGGKKERTEWHNIVVWGDGLVKHIEKMVRKGDKVYIEGQLTTRKWQDQGGKDHYSTEVVIRGWGGRFLLMTDKRQAAGAGNGRDYGGSMNDDSGFGHESFGNERMSPRDELDDDIPFITCNWEPYLRRKIIA